MSTNTNVKEILNLQARIDQRVESYINELEEMKSTVCEQKKQFEKIMSMVEEIQTNYRKNKVKTITQPRKKTSLYKRMESNTSVMEAGRINIKAGNTGLLKVSRTNQYIEGYVNIVVNNHNVSGVGSELSLSRVKTEYNQIIKNIWEFSKVYSFIPDYEDVKSGWSCNRELHVNKKSQCILPAYWKWREKGMNFENPVHNPVGVSHRQYCKYIIWPESGNLQDALNMTEDTPAVKYKLVPGRIKVLCSVYMELVKKYEDFNIIKQLLNEGYNVNIVDGESGNKQSESVNVDYKNINDILSDVNHVVGHGYALSCVLLDHPEWINDFNVSCFNDD